MLHLLTHPVFARLFAAQVVALIGTGLLTVALGLLAFDIAGASAGVVLGTAFAIKMVAYVGLAPLANAAAERLPRKAVLIAADLLRASVALALPFIDAVWQIYALIFVLQAASATFTPAFQATIPDILKDEATYTRALSLSRLAYDLENLLSPALAGVLLLITSYSTLFVGTTLGFLGSAVLVLSAALPPRTQAQAPRPFLDRATRGIRIYLATPRLRGLLALSLTAAASSAFVLVNTVVIVRATYGAGATPVAIALAVYGGGSMLAALALPPLLDRAPDRIVMIAAAWALTLTLAATGLAFASDTLPPWPGFLALWMLLGLFFGAVTTPSGRLLRRSSRPEDRSSLFTAQFTLSHACWHFTYPLAGWLGATIGMSETLLVFAAIAALGALLAVRFWPARAPSVLPHAHPDLPADHPHLKAHGLQRHSHIYVIDDLHPTWP
ncbi:MFS transporter [Chachezhania antarctica]|uniref:MFS transporter n=1 Tax=Chachezhania antarctica TaxID=2340860 RepID=UPI000EB03D64|nr:MFS transporter [Chachezhania antarctica]|tara:strand:+ start:62 stop:1384 length:1323 start_codon:yes stop_codon:yes gene_type:complete